MKAIVCYIICILLLVTGFFIAKEKREFKNQSIEYQMATVLHETLPECTINGHELEYYLYN